MAKRPTRVLAWPAERNRPYNPYNWLLTTHLRAVEPGLVVGEFTPTALLRARWDIWHMHWPEKFLRIPRRAEAALKVGTLAALVRWARMRGTRLVWTVHNLRSHERLYPRMEEWLRTWLVRQLDGVIALSEASAEAALARFPDLRRLPLAIIPHGHYVEAYPNRIDRTTARERLGLTPGQRVFLFIGQVRRYKNVVPLIEAFRCLPDPDLRLVVAGLANDAQIEAEVMAAAGRDDRVLAHLRLIPDDDLQVYLNAAELVVLPYQEILNSGSALLALSFARPLLVPDKGSLTELAAQFGAPWVMTYDGPLTAATLDHALATLARQPADPAALRPRLEQALGWPRIAAETLAFYRTLG